MEAAVGIPPFLFYGTRGKKHTQTALHRHTPGTPKSTFSIIDTLLAHARKKSKQRKSPNPYK